MQNKSKRLELNTLFSKGKFFETAASKSREALLLYARNLYSRDALGLKAEQRYAKRELGGRCVRACPVSSNYVFVRIQADVMYWRYEHQKFRKSTSF